MSDDRRKTFEKRNITARRMLVDLKDFQEWTVRCRKKFGISITPETMAELIDALGAFDKVSKKIPSGLMFEILSDGIIRYLETYLDFTDNEMPAQSSVDGILERMEREMNEKGKV